MNRLVAIAIGGNSIIKDPEHQSVADQYAAICETVRYIVDIIEDGYDTVITHGNGPQVGFILRRSEIAYKVDSVYLNFGRDNQTALDNISAKEIKACMADGHFAAGSMLPKIRAALDFLERGGTRVIITSPHLLKKAIDGQAGTRIYNEET